MLKPFARALSGEFWPFPVKTANLFWHISDPINGFHCTAYVKSIASTDLKKFSIEQPIVCTRQNMKPAYFDCRHLVETTLRATALDLCSEDYQSKIYKALVENPCCCYPSHRCFIDINWGLTAKWHLQDGRYKFLGFKNETTEARSSLFFRWAGARGNFSAFWCRYSVINPPSTFFLVILAMPASCFLGPVQTSNFTCAESNANERKQ